MFDTLRQFIVATIATFLLLAQPAKAASLVTAQWLKDALGKEDMLVIDTSPPKLHAAGHIPGAVGVDLYGSGIHLMGLPQLEARVQAWGISPGKKVVIYDQGATNMATWLFWELHHAGFPEKDLVLLDGGFAKWKEIGGEISKEPTPAPSKGTFRVVKAREDVRVRLPEFFAGSGDLANNVVVEALEPNLHFGDNKFFDRPGHIPKSIMWPNEDFYNKDKTFKSAEEIRRMAAYLGIDPGKQVLSHCGGGIAATVPFFALKFIADYPKVKVYKESQLEWLKDERGLPMWTYDAPYLRREMTWLNGWNSRMMRGYGVSQVSVVDIRPAEAYKQGHVPFALNIPADTFRSHLREPAKLAAVLGPSGVDPNHEAVIVSQGGLNANAALAFVALEKLGQKKVSILMEPIDEWGLQGFPITKEATIVGAPKSPQEFAVAPATYTPKLQAGVLVPEAKTPGLYPKVFVASGKTLLDKPRDGKVVHVPYTELLNANGTPKAAAEIWKALVKAGVPRYAEILVFADDPGEAAINYYVLKMMGFPDVKVLES
jgi:thiosulfate/3-mercaptopyruvate sulfurtransferase